ILLQGTPSTVDMARVQEAILAVEGVLQCVLLIKLHIWSLSESKLVASVHVLIENKNDFVEVSQHILKCLHCHGIH
ncbi:hypothetical protein BY996DRAFT_4584338, partial [Phakopsora pachyrhizi]